MSYAYRIHGGPLDGTLVAVALRPAEGDRTEYEGRRLIFGNVGGAIKSFADAGPAHGLDYEYIHQLANELMVACESGVDQFGGEMKPRNDAITRLVLSLVIESVPDYEQWLKSEIPRIRTGG